MSYQKLIQNFKSSFEKAEAEYMVNNTRFLKDTEDRIKEVNTELETVKENFRYVAEKSFEELEERIKENKSNVN